MQVKEITSFHVVALFSTQTHLSEFLGRSESHVLFMIHTTETNIKPDERVYLEREKVREARERREEKEKKRKKKEGRGEER